MMMNLTIINTTLINDDYEEFEQFDVNDHETKILVGFVLFVPIYILTFLTGLIGNSLVIFSICTVKSLNNITNIFLISLATADLLLIIICVPLKVYNCFFSLLQLI